MNLNKPSGISSRHAVNRVAQLVKPAKAGHADVGRDTMRAVVWSSFLVLFLNLTVTQVVVGVWE